MERYCGVLGRFVTTKGRVYPNKALSLRMLQHGLIGLFEARFSLGLCVRRNKDEEAEDKLEVSVGRVGKST